MPTTPKDFGLIAEGSHLVAICSLRLAVVFWTVFTTVLSGVLTYTGGQLILKLAIEPVQDLKKTIGLISYSLIERAHVYMNPTVGKKEDEDETSRELRKLASQLQSHLFLIPRYPSMAYIFGLPARAEIENASKNLIGLSNGVHSDPNRLNAAHVTRICNSLRIYNELIG